MPDTDAPSRSDSNNASVPLERVNLPADTTSGHKDSPPGELIKGFEGAGHSRLVVYNETLDAPVGMVHIRDVIGYMVRHAQVSPAAKTRRKKPFPADLDLKAIDLGV